MKEPKTILYFLKKSTEFLEKKGIPTPRLDAEVLLADLLQCKRIQLYSKFDIPLDPKEESTYRERIVERGKRMPVAYITGKKGFYQSEFFVSPDTLVPRPETEELVEWVSKSFLKDKSGYRILDLGTGSGCIGISLALENPNHSFVLSDISPGSLAMAKKNAEHCQVAGLSYAESDLFNNIEGLFDIIVSNPPYIPLEEKDSLEVDVRDFEPHLALFVENFIGFHKSLMIESYEHLKAGGCLFLETHPLYVRELVKLAEGLEFQEISLRKDYSGKDRFLFARKKE